MPDALIVLEIHCLVFPDRRRGGDRRGVDIEGHTVNREKYKAFAIASVHMQLQGVVAAPRPAHFHPVADIYGSQLVSGGPEVVGFWRAGSHLFLGRSSSLIAQRRVFFLAWFFFPPDSSARAGGGADELIAEAAVWMQGDASERIVQVPALR